MRRAVVPALLIMVLGYFLFHAIQGEHGLLALRELEKKARVLELRAESMADKRQSLEARVALLRPDNLDPDMLDEQARRSLGFVHPDEVVVLDPDRLITPY
ncbi:cell division protein [Iodidimonas muriae]|uniref:Cell division protein n=1 Tax=Iodidimonas muriae TaxID=261467 RepID=A0ABQ2L7P9_9PROT|nr:septum formation initiator family protein [Iodidimonas muriae]GER08098.1 cell division protein [Kordiimonadales bacterium JCM 17843]GGO06022.1 cell division protein [Iodidimonas muriae]